MTYLICLPFAGASKYSYRDFEKFSNPSLRIVTVELPGRGSRMNESHLKDMHRMVDDLFKRLPTVIHSSRYAFFGHSMGALIAYLLTHKIIKHKYPKPYHLFITGKEGPSAPMTEDEKKHLFPKDRFIEELKKYQGSPQEVLENEELLNFFLPTLLADFEASENYVYQQVPRLDVPMTVITGTEENMYNDEILLWENETIYPVDFRRMSGNHFFIFKHKEEILDIILKKLS
jgi:surfactin synthase thioesterase subunit